MNHSPADVVAHYLADAGLVTDPSSESSWPVYVGHRPHTPNDSVTATDREGKHNGRSMVDGTVYQHYGVQLVARSASAPEGFVKLNNIVEHLDTNINRTLVPIGSSTYRIQNISRNTPVFALGREDGTGCYLHSVNLLASIKALAGTGSY